MIILKITANIADDFFNAIVADDYMIMYKALKQITLIENKLDCGDWDEIEEARDIAIRALDEIKLKETVEYLANASKVQP